MGKWVSAEEAAKHLRITTSAVRKRASTGKLAREAQPNGNYLYWLDDDQLDPEVSVESAMQQSGVDVLAAAIHEATTAQEQAIAAIRAAYEGQIAAKDALIAELRSARERAEMELEREREALRAERERLRAQAEAVDLQLRAVRETMEARARRRWWAPWRA